MKAEYSVEEVRAMAAEISDYGGTQAGLMLTAYAERIKADEGVVPDAWISHRRVVGLPYKDFYGKLPIQSLQPGFYSHTPLFKRHQGPVLVPSYVLADDANRLYGDELGVDWEYEVVTAEMSPNPPAQAAQLWEMKQRACRAHALCNELRLAHPEIPELGDDGVLHEAIHDILRVDTPTAAPAQAAQVDAWQIVCDSIRKHQFSDENRRGRLTIDVETLLREINIRKDAEPVAHHPDDAAVDAFADAMKAKLAEARAKGRGGWQDKADCPQQRLSDMLRAHIEKGDPCDVANFCMFLHQRGESILPAEPVARPTTNSPGTASKLVGEPVAQGEVVDEVARLQGVIERDRTVFCNLIAGLKRELQTREWLGNENARAAGGYRYDEPGFIREFGEAWTAIMAALNLAHSTFRDFTDCPRGDAIRTAQADAEVILAAQPRAVPGVAPPSGWPALEADLAQECERAMRQRDAYLKTRVSTVGGGSHDLHFGHILRRHGVSLAATTRAAFDIKAMVDRFLGWRLPDDFAPDAGISFAKPTNPAWWPVGTNLFTADQAEQMFRYVLDAAPSATPAQPAERVVGDAALIPRHYASNIQLAATVMEQSTSVLDRREAPVLRKIAAMLAAAPQPGESS